MRRLFAFLFRHDFDMSKGRLNHVQLTVRRSMVCRKCGFETELFPIMDRSEFSFWYRIRGCPGHREAK